VLRPSIFAVDYLLFLLSFYLFIYSLQGRMEGTREPRRTKPPRRTTSVGSEDETEFVEEESLLEYVRSAPSSQLRCK
jgi:hypothetical protein